MPYRPKPVDTSGVHLSENLNNIVDQLALNVHEKWAAIEMSQGWRYGSERNDLRKEQPCLVPFEDLPASEKEHDHLIARETIKYLLILGYGIYRVEKKK